MFPTDTTTPERVAKRSGGNCREMIFRAPMNPQAMPAPVSKPAEDHDARRVGDREQDHPGEGREIEGRHDLRRAETIQEEAPGDLEQGVGVEEGRRHETQGPHVHRDVPHQIRRQHGDGGPVEHGEPEENRNRREKDPPAAIGEGLGALLRTGSWIPVRVKTLCYCFLTSRARHHRRSSACLQPNSYVPRQSSTMGKRRGRLPDGRAPWSSDGLSPEYRNQSKLSPRGNSNDSGYW